MSAPVSSLPRRLVQIVGKLARRVTRVPSQAVATLAGVSGPRLRLAARVTAWGLTLAYFGFALLLLALRYAVLPQIENYRGDLEQLIGKAIERPVGIRHLEAHWAGLRPALTLTGFEIRDAQGQSALGFEQIVVELSWASLLYFELRLARLELDSPTLVLRRDAQGRLYAASLEITPTTGPEDGFSDWLLVQERVLVRNARIVWRDELRRAPELELKQLNFQLDNNGNRHRFGLTAEPPKALAARLDLRGDFKAADIDQLESWKGQAYAELDYADLAGWQPWLDYAIALPQGTGALRLWLGFANQQITSAAADIRLADVRLKLRADLPELSLTQLEGRLSARRLDQGFALEAKHLTLATPEGVTIQPTDLKLNWHPAVDHTAPYGSATANNLDLNALARLAAHLPLDDALRARLARHAPQGKIIDLELAWKGGPGSTEKDFALQSWRVAGRVEGLGLTALGPIPGLSGVNGRISGTQKGGSLHLDGRAASLTLPTIFPEPHLALEGFDADFSWKAASDGLHVTLNKASFHNQDLAGDASGSWYELPQGPGAIDLSARLSRAKGDAVWRYLPLGAGKSTPEWLHRALTHGTASDTALKLKGDLSHFPFRGGKNGASAGLFEVRGKVHDVTLRYAPDWPEISHIEGDLLFSGERMLISGRSGKVFGVDLREVTAEIADLELVNPLLTITGKASGPAADFLRFIEDSPISEQIDRFTEDMSADGKGELDIKLSLPLETLDRSKVFGTFHFNGNRVTIDPDLPPFTDVRGDLKFSSDDLDAKGLRGLILGTPLTVDIKTLSAGNLVVQASGEAAVATLKQKLALPLFDHLSGSAKWTGQLRVKKNTSELKISSNLVGLSSSLPEPFNKPATEPMAFSFERRQPPSDNVRVRGSRASAGTAGGLTGVPTAAPIAALPLHMLDISLGRTARLQAIRQHDTRPTRVVRGFLSIGETTATLPDRNVLIALNLPKLNVDFWRNAFSLREGTQKAASEVDPWSLLGALPNVQFDLRARELTVEDRRFNEFQISGNRIDAITTRFELKSRELAGTFDWNGLGKGKLTGRVGQFSIPAGSVSATNLQSTASEMIKQMPALDLTVDQLLFNERSLGSAHIIGENRNDYWHSKIDLKNDDGRLEVSGRWRPSLTEPDTQLDLKLTAKSIEKMLNRIGYPDTVKRGTANVSANLAWNGAPFAIDYPSLTGKLTLAASNGQFSQLEPGVGRLLGILSLQSLPRRITLDFRDIFSQGFAFDSIDGDFTLSAGVMDTLAPKQLQIKGPAAKVAMDGSINLGDETQQLHVRVQPAVGESIAVGAMLANPVIGAAVWAAQKLLNDPVGQAFSFDYRVVGSWADPKVEKLANPAINAAGKPEK